MRLLSAFVTGFTACLVAMPGSTQAQSTADAVTVSASVDKQRNDEANYITFGVVVYEADPAVTDRLSLRPSDAKLMGVWKGGAVLTRGETSNVPTGPAYILLDIKNSTLR